ncbi:MAG: tyrosine-type recombinase/integrase [Anaerolineales bacterium]|nr:tyrosine-type recombinase/integrase [Anaerolineales bacterium]
MPYQVHREVREGQLCRLALGIALVDEYLDFLRCRCRPNTWLNYAHDLKVFFNTIEKPVSEVSTADVFRFIQCQHPPPVPDPNSHVPPAGVCIRTLKRRLTAVSGLYSYLLTRDDPPIHRNPVPAGLPWRGPMPSQAPRAAPLLRAPQPLPQVVPAVQVQQFLASLNTYRDKAIVLLMALAGLRKSEVLNLELADIHPSQGTVNVRQGKGGRQRLCCIAPLFFQAVDRYQRDERPATLVLKLFVVLKGPRRGQPLSVSGLNTIIAHHRRLARTPDLTCHRLRHTCLTMLRTAGMSLEALQQQAGHQNINTTRVYLHLSDQGLRDEYFRVADQLFRPPDGEAHDA